MNEYIQMQRRYAAHIILLVGKFEELPLAKKWGELQSHLPHIQTVGAALEAQVAHTDDNEVLTLTLQFALNIAPYLSRQREINHPEWLAAGLTASEKLGDRKSAAYLWNELGSHYTATGDKKKALEQYQQALALWRELAQPKEEAATLNNLGRIYFNLRDNNKALESYQQALTIYQTLDDPSGKALTLKNLGRLHSQLAAKETEQALTYYQESLALSRRDQASDSDRRDAAYTLNDLGFVYFNQLKELAKALEYYQQALELHRELGNKHGEAVTLHTLGEVYSKTDPKKALTYYQEALPLRRAVYDRWGEANTLSGIGKLYRDLDQLKEAITYLSQAVAIEEESGHYALAKDRQLLAELKGLGAASP
ncbi:MAG: tetratricopeptide repeat protein [Chloroflexota bacterium]